MDRFFTWFAGRISSFAGQPVAFVGALALIVIWGVTGPIFQYSDTWQLVINTATTIVTFLMVFLIQSTQNRDTEAIQLKLDELIVATKGARNVLLNLEDLEEDALEEFRARYQELADAAREKTTRKAGDRAAATSPDRTANSV